MKLMISNPGIEANADFTNKWLVDGGVDLSDVSDNECEQIVLNGILNQVETSQVVALLQTVSKKLRKNGKLCFNGIDLRVMCRRLLKGEIDDETFNHILNNSKSIVSLTSIKGIVHQSKLIIDSLVIKGEQYEFVVTR